MKKHLDLSIKGPLAETNAIFNVAVEPLTQVNIDFSEMTYINSVGVKNWMLWVHKVPASSQILLYRCPFVIINQSVIVTGFLPSNVFLMSFQAPYYCDSCHEEKYHLLERGRDYEYPVGGGDPRLSVAEEIPCPRCHGIMEPDFVFEKTFLFLRKSG